MRCVGYPILGKYYHEKLNMVFITHHEGENSMADNRKEQERAELYRTIWSIANDLRGSVDGWDFKQYVLGMLFYRYISENLTS